MVAPGSEQTVSGDDKFTRLIAVLKNSFRPGGIQVIRLNLINHIRKIGNIFFKFK